MLLYLEALNLKGPTVENYYGHWSEEDIRMYSARWQKCDMHRTRFQLQVVKMQCEYEQNVIFSKYWNRKIFCTSFILAQTAQHIIGISQAAVISVRSAHPWLHRGRSSHVYAALNQISFPTDKKPGGIKGPKVFIFEFRRLTLLISALLRGGTHQ